MTAKRFIFMAAILLLLCTGLGIYGFVKASEHPKDYQSAGEIRWVLPPSTSHHIEYKDGVFFVSKGDKMSVMTVKDGKPQWRARGVLKYGGKDRLIYREDGKYGYMDLDGKVLIKARYDYAEAFYGDYALVRNGENLSYMVIDRHGNELYTFEEETTVMWEKEGLLSIYDDGRGEPDRILDCRSGTYAEYEQSLSPLGEGLYSELVKTKDDDALLVIRDKDGCLKLGGERFCSIDQFDHGVSYVKKENGQCGYMNTKGEMVFTLGGGWEASSFREGKGVVDTGKRILIVDEKGRTIAERPKGDIVGVRFCVFSEGVSQLCIKKDGEKPPESWGYMDENGEFVVPPIFLHVEPVSQGCAIVQYRSSMGIVKVK